MKIGITGATGFIGQYLVRDYGEKVEFVAPVIENPNILEKAYFYFCDCSVENLCRLFEGCDAVIHLAARVWKNNSEQVLMNDYIKNSELTANVFEACRINGIKKVVHASSRAVYDWERQEEGLLNETEHLKPKNAYGVSKKCDEVLASYYNDVFGMGILSYRFPEVCGLDISHGMVHPFWKRVLQCSVDKQPVPLWGGGYAGRDLLYVKDAVDALMFGVNSKKSGIFNICSGKKTTNREIAESFCITFDNSSGILIQADKEEWGVKSVLDPAKAENELGYKIKYDLDSLVLDIKNEYYEYVKRH